MSVHEYENQKARTCLVIMHTGGGDTDVRYTTLLTQALEAGLFKTTYLRYALTVLLGFFGLASMCTCCIRPRPLGCKYSMVFGLVSGQCN